MILWYKACSCSIGGKKLVHNTEHYVLVNKLCTDVSVLCTNVSLRRYGISDWTLADLKAAKARSFLKKGPVLFAPEYTGIPGVQFHSIYHNSKFWWEAHPPAVMNMAV